MDLVQVFRPAIVVDLSEYNHNMECLLAVSTNKVYFARKIYYLNISGENYFLACYYRVGEGSFQYTKQSKLLKRIYKMILFMGGFHCIE